MAKFNPYKINPFKILSVVGTVLQIVLAALSFGLFCYAAVLLVWDSWGWWALTAPLIWIAGLAVVVAVFVLIGGGYITLKNKYEDAKWRHDRDERLKKFAAQEVRITEMEEDRV